LASLTETRERLLTSKLLDDTSEAVHHLNIVREQQSVLVEKTAAANDALLVAHEHLAVVCVLHAELGAFVARNTTQLHTWQSSQPSDRLKDDETWLAAMRLEMTRRETDLTRYEGLIGEWSRTATAAARESMRAQATDVRRQWRALRLTLDKWHECVLNMRKDDESLQLEFDALRNELEEWMNEVAERKLGDERAAMMATLKENETKTARMDGLRDKALELCVRGGEIESQVEPQLATMNTKWQEIQGVINVSGP